MIASIEEKNQQKKQIDVKLGKQIMAQTRAQSKLLASLLKLKTICKKKQKKLASRNAPFSLWLFKTIPHTGQW